MVNHIKNWQLPQQECWEDIDPYSDLEEVLSDDASSTPSTDKDINTSDEESISNQKGNYSLCEWKTKTHTSTRPVHSVSKNVSYMNKYTTLDLPPSPKKCKPLHRAVSSGPSLQRIASRGKATVPPKIMHQVPVKKPRKVKQKTAYQQVETQTPLQMLLPMMPCWHCPLQHPVLLQHPTTLLTQAAWLQRKNTSLCHAQLD